MEELITPNELWEKYSKFPDDIIQSVNRKLQNSPEQGKNNVTINQENVNLTSMQFDRLAYLLAEAGYRIERFIAFGKDGFAIRW